MAESEKATEYKELNQKSKKILSEYLELIDKDVSEIKKQIKRIADQKFYASHQPTNSDKLDLEIQKKHNEVKDISKKMKEILCSLNEDEKKEFKQLELINDDDIDKAKWYALDKLELDLKNDLITVEEYLIKRKELDL